MLRSTVPLGIENMALGRYVARAYPLLSARSAFRRRDVKVNGVRRDEKFPVSAGDEVLVYENMDTSIAVAGEAGGLFAVIKPQGLPVDADSDGVGEDTALSRARLLYPGAELCHRLDAQTGGVLLLAAEPGALDMALAEFRERRVHKRYIALCGGAFAVREGVYKDFIVKDARNARVRIVKSGGLPVETKWRVAENVDLRLSLMELEPVTGRTHQLRAHMAYYGNPILGDDKYGDRTLNREYGAKLCLWCEEIRILGNVFRADAPDWLEAHS